MNLFRTMIVAGAVALMGAFAWSGERANAESAPAPTDQATRYIDVNGTVVPVQEVRRYRYYRSPYYNSYGWRPYYYGRPYYSSYYGTPRAGYYDYGYGRGAVRVGPVQVWW